MDVVFDTLKNQVNIDKHGLSFDDVTALDWDEALVVEDARKEYGETRYRAFVRNKADNLPYSVAFTVRGTTMRIISFRRAHEKERMLYEQR